MDGDVKGLASLVGLTTLDLEYTVVVGDVNSLAPLVKLEYLNLHQTGVVGDAMGLAPLGNLTMLDLGYTTVLGCIAFCDLPFHVHCDPHPDPDYGCKCIC